MTPFGGRGLSSVVGVALGSTGFRSHAARIKAVTKIQICFITIKLVTMIFGAARLSLLKQAV